MKKLYQSILPFFILISFFSQVVTIANAQDDYFLRLIKHPDGADFTERDQVVNYANIHNNELIICLRTSEKLEIARLNKEFEYETILHFPNLSANGILHPIRAIDSNSIKIIGYYCGAQSCTTKIYTYDFLENSLDSTFYIVNDPIDLMQTKDVVEFEDHYYILGRHFNRIGDYYVYSSVHKVDFQGNLDWVYFDDSVKIFNAQNIHITPDHNIGFTTVRKGEPGVGNREFYRYVELSQSGTYIHSWRLEDMRGLAGHTHTFSLLDNEGYLVLNTDYKFNEWGYELESITKCNLDGEIIYEYTSDTIWQDFFNKHTQRFYKGGAIAQNGDYLIAGVSPDTVTFPDQSDYFLNFYIHLTRISPDGKKLFSRFYSMKNTLFSIPNIWVNEGFDGSLYLYGIVDYVPNPFERPYEWFNSGFLLKVDANGCLNPDDCGRETVVSTRNILQPEIDYQHFDLFPNPVSSDKVFFDSSIELKEAYIYDLNGKVVDMVNLSGTNSIAVDALPAGYYILIGVDRMDKYYRSAFIRQ